ncbi:MAG: energy-coupling factor transporter transmembrane protein EcfT [Firmicutes bacterium]|nr:energy-coupling factor transporter transmembrane protein EcfT [Bacillota bacterium]
MQIGKYILISSNMHKMNPFIKLLCLLLFVISMFLSNSILSNIILSVLLIFVILNTNIKLINYLKLIYKMKWFLLFIIIIDLILKIPLNTIIITIIRIIYTVIYSNIILFSTTLNDITYALEKLFSPLKILGVKVNRMALSISLALRFIPNLFEQAKKILKTQASRGIDYKYNFKNKIICVTSLVIPLFNLSMKSSDNLADIMHVRLYDIDSKRTKFKDYNILPIDIIMLLIHICLLVIIIVREVIL